MTSSVDILDNYTELNASKKSFESIQEKLQDDTTKIKKLNMVLAAITTTKPPARLTIDKISLKYLQEFLEIKPELLVKSDEIFKEITDIHLILQSQIEALKRSIKIYSLLLRGKYINEFFEQFKSLNKLIIQQNKTVEDLQEDLRKRIKSLKLG